MEYVLGTNAGLGIAIDQQQGKIYFSTWGNPPIKDKIQTANLDGSYVEDIVIFDDPTSFPRQICLDLPLGKIYWPDSWYDIIYRANLDGSEVEEILTGLDGPYGLALDLSASKIYCADCFSGKIRRANLDGTNVEDVLTNLGGLRSLAIDEEAGKLYWSRLRFLPEGGDIGRVNLNGTDAERQLVTGLGYSVITLDTYAHKIYWTEIRAYEYGTGMIRRANLDGSNIEVLLTGLSKPTAIAIIPEAATIYVPDDYSTIQAAVDAANPGDTIIVRDGTYIENVNVNKDHLTIRSENGAERTVVQAANPDDHVFEVTRDYVNINGFTPTGATGALSAGIYLSGDYCNISSNIASKNFIGINLSPYSKSNIIYLNDFIDNTWNWNKLNAYPLPNLNNWSSDEKITYTYNASNYTNYLGNYWDDYTGSDADGDGIGDIPYNVDSDQDNYPVMELFENYLLPAEPVEHVLTVSKTGSGTIISSPSGINCGSDCTEAYEEGTKVTLTATADDGWIVTDWDFENADIVECQMCELNILRGLDTGANISVSCTITMNRSINAHITFERAGVIKVTKTGSGTVVSSPGGIDCGCDCSTVFFGDSRIVTLTAIPAIGATFLGWEGDCSGTGTCVLDTTRHRNVTANFTQGGQFLLTVSKTGSGTIISSPAGINCGSDCSETYEDGTKVTLTIEADSGWAITDADFTDLSGSCTKRSLTELQILILVSPVPVYSFPLDLDIVEPETIAITFSPVIQPEPPIPTSPGSASEPGPIIETLTPELQWEDVPDADYYALAISEEPYGHDHIVYNPQELYGTSHHVPDGELEPGKKYRWNMQAHNSAGWSDISNTLYFQTYIPPEPPAADAGSDQSVSSGEVVWFDASNSTPKGAIVSYEWDFEDGEVKTGWKVSHRFRGAQNETKTYTVTLTVEDDKGSIDSDTTPVTVVPLEKPVEVTHHPTISIPGEPVFARMIVSYNWIHHDIYVVTKIRYQSEGFLGIGAISVWDMHSGPVWHPIWASNILTKGDKQERTYYPKLHQVLYGGDTFEGISVDAFDTMNIYFEGWAGIHISVGPFLPLPFFDTKSACFQPDYTEFPDLPIEAPNLDLAHLCSPGELRVYDSQRNVTGLVNGVIKEEIPNSCYGNNAVVIFLPFDSYFYEVVGTDEGTYGLAIVSVEDGNTITFEAVDIPTSPEAVHDYIVDWEALSHGEDGVVLAIDADGDGVFERTIISDNKLTACKVAIELTGYELISQDQIGDTEFEYTFRVLARNSADEDIKNIVFKLVQLPSKTSVIDGIAYFSIIEPREEILCNDTVKIRSNRSFDVLKSEFLWQACKCIQRPRSDFNPNWRIDLLDLAEFANKWLETCSEPNWCQGRDLDYSTTVDFSDFAIFADNWLWEIVAADFDIDDDVDFDDYAVFAEQWVGQNCAESAWCDGADLNKNGEVEIFDLAIFVEGWLEGTIP